MYKRQGYIKCRATAVGEDTTLSQIIKMGLMKETGKMCIRDRFISNKIQWKTQFNLNKVCFFHPCKIFFVPVSYTHLDVYKRQLQSSAMQRTIGTHKI